MFLHLIRFHYSSVGLASLSDLTYSQLFAIMMTLCFRLLSAVALAQELQQNGLLLTLTHHVSLRNMTFCHTLSPVRFRQLWKAIALPYGSRAGSFHQ